MATRLRNEFSLRYASDGWYVVNNWVVYRDVGEEGHEGHAVERHYQFVLFEFAVRVKDYCELHKVRRAEIEVQLLNFGLGWDCRYTWWGRMKGGHDDNDQH